MLNTRCQRFSTSERALRPTTYHWRIGGWVGFSLGMAARIIPREKTFVPNWQARVRTRRLVESNVETGTILSNSRNSDSSNIVAKAGFPIGPT
ncbi:hypothetical protein AVEN_83064-1 [Araneus ventricosus]|uniref:Uncharacterized protein n=1 Tax=Araneus ventricosus TaxID=182803 RepID=A0A4Y2AM55_ARAVE|nr:hypothetical protein AVEN_83064-1 [Araneus ventricosus]